ncbi:MAG: amino acid permease [Candidatus Thorarchaeota archaeon]|nr:amino acid permease [Candidatus Thorarchaeota archaeon]
MTETIGEERSNGKFARRLGLIGATNIGLGAMLGGGIYVISGTAAGMIGPALVFAYLVTGALTVFTAINYSELACSIPKQGGGYTFAHDTWGGFPGFLTGWFLLIGNVVACGLYSLAVAHTLAVFLPGDPGLIVGWIAIVIIVITFVTNLVSIKGVTGVLGVLNIAQALVLFVFIAVGLFFINPANLDPILKEGTGITQFMATVSFIYISFVGFELITTASEEIKDPARNIPRAIVLTLFIATIVYMLAAFVIVGVVPYTSIADSPTPISDVYGFMLGPGAFIVGLAGMAASNYAALNATFLATARVAYSMGRDGNLPKLFSRVSSRFKTPIPALVASLLVVSAFALTGNVHLVASLSDFGYLIGLAIVNASVIQLKRKGLGVPGTFKARFYPAIPILGVVSCLMLVPTLSPNTLELGALLSLAGLVIYLVYARSSHRRHNEQLNAITNARDQQR